jgi:hypothetical protein
MVEEMRRQTEDLIRYYGELDRRVAHTGMEGITGLLEVSQHVQTALDAVSAQELEWMVAEVRSLLDRLVRMDAQLGELRALKLLLAEARNGS